MMRRWLARFAGLFGKNRRDHEFADELNAHLEAHIADNVRDGMSPQAAKRDAMLKLGGAAMTTEAYRQQRSLPIVESCARELRQAFHRLRRSPAFTATAVLSLALAIAANVAIFAVVERVVIHPLPYPQSQQLIMLDFSMPSRNIPAGFNSITIRQYFHYTDNARIACYVPAWRAARVNPIVALRTE